MIFTYIAYCLSGVGINASGLQVIKSDHISKDFGIQKNAKKFLIHF